MSASIWVAMAALAGSAIAGLLTYLASRKTSDDSRAIGLINAGQVSLEAALKRATDEITESENRRKRDADEQTRQIAELRNELAAVRAELDTALQLHANCERQRLKEAHELAELRLQIGRKP